MEEIGFIAYPGRSYGRGILVNFKSSDSSLVAKKVCHKKSDEVIVGRNTEGLKRFQSANRYEQCLDNPNRKIAYNYEM